jgi:malate synthase
MTHIRYYEDYLSPKLKEKLLSEASAVAGVEGLGQVGEGGGLETKESLTFLVKLYQAMSTELNKVLDQRMKDREFIDQRVKTSGDFNVVFGLEDAEGRIVVGPHSENYCSKGEGPDVAEIPEYLKGSHVTLFGPPDSAKLSINAMNSYHRTLKNEPEVIKELLEAHPQFPKWGADDEDSKTPLRSDLISAGENLNGCFKRTLRVEDKKTYELMDDKLALPIKRFPGLALPSFFLFHEGEPLPLHMYDFALHFFEHWNNPEALVFYVPKLENEEEARYIKKMIETAENLIKAEHSEYKLGTVRLMIVLENPRAVFRVNEIMDELHPYFAGASLGWHDYLGSTARLFKEDSNYRIPVKADPDIVIKYIKASHNLLADVVGARGGIKVGGMYGILPTNTDLDSRSFQITMRGFIKDVITQMKRNLTGYWVAHPDFVRIGLALVSAWKFWEKGDKSKLDELVKGLLHQEFYEQVMDFIKGDDIEGLDKTDPLYARSLIVADVGESNIIANNDPKEIRYNVFQSLQYLTDWLCGNGCVALPAIIDGEAIRVMDDLATAERSRWEVWHEIYHGRFSLEEFLKIAHEEFLFIRKDLSNDQKIVEVKWDERTAKWYPVAFNLMVKLMTDKDPVEFATELLLPFTIESVRASETPWDAVKTIDAEKFHIDDTIERFNYYFERCGEIHFAHAMAKDLIHDDSKMEKIIMAFDQDAINSAAGFHGDIGENKKTLDKMASGEQAGVEDSLQAELRALGEEYKKKFQMKFLISAKGKSGGELKAALLERMNNDLNTELVNAKTALYEITKKRTDLEPFNSLKKKIEELKAKYGIKNFQVTAVGSSTFAMGDVDAKSHFQIASLSKTIGSAFALEYFREKGIGLDTKVNELFKKTSSDFRLEGECADDVELKHLMSHLALNMHYVYGIPADQEFPKLESLLAGEHGYEKCAVKNKPGTTFSYSGAGFMVLEHLLESLEGKPFSELSQGFLTSYDLQFDHKNHSDQLNFPYIAAGAHGSSRGMANFLRDLEIAYNDIEGAGPISHDTAVRMLHGVDRGCMEFMHSKIGLGVFIVEAGLNKFMLHQGANDGYRAIYLHCYQGPDRGKGFVVFATGELEAVKFISTVSQELLKELKVSGIDFDKFVSDFDTKGISSEQIVNMGYKELIFKAFEPTLPEAIENRGALYEFADKNLLNGAQILKCSNQNFARAENLISNHIPVFDPELFGAQGKVMDSWESARHNLDEYDSLELELRETSKVSTVFLSTMYHLGNQVKEVELLCKKSIESEWQTLLGKCGLEGHSNYVFKVDGEVKYLQVRVYPDGGLSRLALFNEDIQVETGKCLDSIPTVKKPLHLPFEIGEAPKLEKGQEYNAASALHGAKVTHASNEHYAPASQVISPYPPISMFDGFESARSHKADHHEEITIKLAKKTKIHRIECDFTYFVNNNPRDIEFVGITERDFVKPFAGNIKTYEFKTPIETDELKVKIYPDGGINRIRAYSIHDQ